MALRYFPRFTQENYAEARHRFPHLALPRSWDEWANRVFQKLARATSVGDTLVQVDVDLDGFADYADARDAMAEFYDLECYVVAKVHRRA